VDVNAVWKRAKEAMSSLGCIASDLVAGTASSKCPWRHGGVFLHRCRNRERHPRHL